MKNGIKRMAWLSPYGPRSDIGSFTRKLLPHLEGEEAGHRFETHLYVHENGPTYPSPVPSMVLQRQPDAQTLLALYDFPVFQVGNNQENHASIVELMRKVPGVLVLHDHVYQHCLAFDLFETRRAGPSYARLMGHQHGLEGLDLVHRSGVCRHDGALFLPWETEHVARFPLFQMMTGLAAAVVVHSDFSREQLRGHGPAPVLQLALPHDQKTHPSEEDLAEWRRATAGTRRVRFTSFGHIGRPKLLDRAVQAFAASPWLREHAELMLVGHPGDVEHLEELRAMIGALGVEPQVIIELSVSDARLATLKAQTDVFINLRHPNTEGGSGSLVEQLNTGRPVVVHRSGCYADLPEGAAVPWHREEGIDVLTHRLETLGQQPQTRIDIGAAGRDHVRRMDAARYARELRRFLLDIEPELAALRRPDLARPAALRAVAPLRAQIETTRRRWMELEADPQACGPEPFLCWDVEAVVRYAQILLEAGDGGSFFAVARARVEADRGAFYRDVSLLRALWRAVGDGKTSDPAHPFVPCLRESFWALALEMRPERLPRLMQVGLGVGPWSEQTDRWSPLFRTVFDRHATFWVFLNSRERRLVLTHNEGWSALTQWALERAGGSEGVGRAVRRAWSLGLLDADRDLVSRFGTPNGESLFDEEDYLARHPDVAQEVKAGRLASGRDHFLHFGRREGRAFAFTDVRPDGAAQP